MHSSVLLDTEQNVSRMCCTQAGRNMVRVFDKKVEMCGPFSHRSVAACKEAPGTLHVGTGPNRIWPILQEAAGSRSSKRLERWNATTVSFARVMLFIQHIVQCPPRLLKILS